jgi:hypothetical protein
MALSKETVKEYLNEYTRFVLIACDTVSTPYGLTRTVYRVFGSHSEGLSDLTYMFKSLGYRRVDRAGKIAITSDEAIYIVNDIKSANPSAIVNVY